MTILDDMFEYRLVSELQLSPDGDRVVVVLSAEDVEGDTTRTHLWLAATGRPPRQLTQGDGNDRSPRWSPDGRQIAFLSSRTGSAQIHVISPDGGEARAVTSREGGAGKPVWSPRGDLLLFTASVPLEDKPDGVPAARWARRPRVVRKARFKSDGQQGVAYESVMQIFRVPLDGGDPEQLTDGETDCMGPAWAPGRDRIVFTRQRGGVRAGHESDIWSMRGDGSDLQQLTFDLPSATLPAVSPDGSLVAFHATREAGDSRSTLWLVGIDGTRQRELAGDPFEVATSPLARSSPPSWSPSGAEVIEVQAERGRAHVVAIAVGDGQRRRLTRGDVQVTLASAAAKAPRVAYALDGADLASGIRLVSLDGGEDRELFDPNGEWRARQRRPDVAWRRFALRGGERDGLLLTSGATRTPAPLLVDVHGGPHSSVELGFPYHPCWYELVERGWAVLALNAIGSGSYGAEFARALRGRWGELDLPEHLEAIDILVAEGTVDPDRVAIAGKSYGGYMAAWAVGTTTRFAAAVVAAPVTDLVSHLGTSDSGYYVDPFDQGGTLAERHDTYVRLSPITHAHRVTTPTLLLQGQDDGRCPSGQSEELFQEVLAAGAPVEMVLYPGGDHHLAESGKPSHRRDYHGRLVDWVERWCRRDASRRGDAAATDD